MTNAEFSVRDGDRKAKIDSNPATLICHRFRFERMTNSEDDTFVSLSVFV